MLYVFICMMVGLAIVALTLVITEVWLAWQDRKYRRSADRIWKESDR